MESFIEYKGYIGNANFDKIDRIFYGKVLGISSYLSYEGKNMYLLKSAFCQVIDEYEKSLKAIEETVTIA